MNLINSNINKAFGGKKKKKKSKSVIYAFTIKNFLRQYE